MIRIYRPGLTVAQADAQAKKELHVTLWRHYATAQCTGFLVRPDRTARSEPLCSAWWTHCYVALHPFVMTAKVRGQRWDVVLDIDISLMVCDFECEEAEGAALAAARKAANGALVEACDQATFEWEVIGLFAVARVNGGQEQAEALARRFVEIGDSVLRPVRRAVEHEMAAMGGVL
jgi:hypothetical protein